MNIFSAVIFLCYRESASRIHRGSREKVAVQTPSERSVIKILSVYFTGKVAVTC